jgi:nucleotide-binding universal stress UspA family protein
MSKPLLVPTDFSECSKSALDQAVALAKKLEAEVVLMNAWELPVIGLPDGAIVATPEWATRIMDACEKSLREEAARHAASGVKIRTLAKQGDSWRAILDVAAELPAEMIVMGTHGRRGLPRALLGSVAEKVVRTAECPVLTVRVPAK